MDNHTPYQGRTAIETVSGRCDVEAGDRLPSILELERPPKKKKSCYSRCFPPTAKFIQSMCSSHSKVHGRDSEPPTAIFATKVKRKRSLSESSASNWGSLFACDPTTPLYYKWLAVVTCAIIYNLIFVIGRSVFWELNNAVPVIWFIFDYSCDTIYVIDTLIHAHEGYLDQGIMIQDPKLLRGNYLASWCWVYDVASILPTDAVYWWWPPDYCNAKRVPCPVLARVNRLMRFPRMLEFFDRTETSTGFPNTFRITKVVFAIIVLIHWNACFYFLISYAIGFGSDNWVYNLNGEKNTTLTRQYIYSFYWSTLTLTTIGETPQPENDAEYIFVVVDFLAGVLIFASIVGNIGNMISNMNVARMEFQNKMDGVKQYMNFRRVSKELEARVIRWFAYTWANKQALHEERVLATLPDKLKAEIAIHVHLKTLKQVRIFQDCEPGLLQELVLKLRLQVFSPGDYICRKGDVGREMYIVKRGKLSVVADDDESVLATLGPGSVFGEISVLDIAGNRTGNRRTANVRSVGYSDLFCLSKSDLWEALSDYPDAKHSLIERGCQLLRKDGLLDEQVFVNAQAENENVRDKMQKLEKSLESLQRRFTKLMTEYLSHHSIIFQRLHKLEKKECKRMQKNILRQQLNLKSGRSSDDEEDEEEDGVEEEEEEENGEQDEEDEDEEDEEEEKDSDNKNGAVFTETVTVERNSSAFIRNRFANTSIRRPVSKSFRRALSQRCRKRITRRKSL
ncbi:cyclic nucleotide-gated cation channel subunit A-like [Nilaparvata lugens]|uniref:cyclic nucleotide-gated cation channel subunit A-like n=1 Tax=Nilaparvata lugens TaxID=108931 RepID=UPI00193E0993|nr:cyclic nucleotide-gated cation channel subunit A-like [Nilaparvata lugens]